MSRLASMLLLTTVVTWSTLAGAQPAISVSEIIDIAASGVGSNYIWGGGCWDPSNRSWRGADCSGFVAKAWQVPSRSDVTTCSHPYSTWNFYNESTHWDHIDRGAADRGDAFVRRADGAGHVILFASGDPWGWSEVYEARGSAYGIVHRDKDIGSDYRARRRRNLAPRCEAHCEGDIIVGDDCGRGDCSVYGSSCVDDALGPRCVFFACPAVGTAEVCIDADTVGSCDDGALLSQGDCGAYAAYCSTAGGTPAHCASVFCVDDPDTVPVAHDVCLPDGDRYHCDSAGGLTAMACGAGERCTVHPEVHCAADLPCPAEAEALVCSDEAVVRCMGGAIVEVIDDCSADGWLCSTESSADPTCVEPPPEEEPPGDDPPGDEEPPTDEEPPYDDDPPPGGEGSGGVPFDGVTEDAIDTLHGGCSAAATTRGGSLHRLLTLFVDLG